MKRNSVQSSSDPETPGEQTEEAPVSVSLSPEARAVRERARNDPADSAAWDELDEFARESERPEGVSQVYREVLSRQLDPALVDSVGRRAVAFHEEWFEDPALVIDVLRRVLELEPSAEWAFERLSLLLTMAERWDDLLAVYDAALSTCTDREKKKALLDEAARIAKDFAGSTDRAISYLKQLVPLRPEDAQLAGSLERRLLLQKRYRDLIDVWTARLPVLSPSEVLATRVRIAEAWLERLADAGVALGTVREILAGGSGEAEASRLLERIGTHSGAPVATRREALGLLKDRFSALGKSSDSVRAIELLLGVVDEPAERIRLHAEAADLLSASNRLAEAVEHSAEWLALSPTPEVRDGLRDLAERAGARARYAEALVRAAKATADGAVRVEFLIDAGRVREALSEPHAAIALFTQVLDDPDVDEASLLDVARRLTTLLVEPSHATQRLGVLERLAALESDSAERRRLLGEAAMLAESLGDTDHSLGLWRRRLDADAKDFEALDATVDLLATHRRWEALVAALGRRHEASSDPSARRADLVQIAEVYRENLDNLPAAIDTWRRVESEFGANAETMDALADLSASAQRWSDVTALLRAAAQQTDDVSRRAGHLTRMGDVYRTQRDAPLRAVEAYREALEMLPAHEGARGGLEALLDDPDAGAEAVETLAKSFADAHEWEGTLALVERRLERAKDDSFRRDVLLEAARLVETSANDERRALAYVRRAFALVREPVIEQELVRLAEDTNGWAECAAGYAEAVASCTDEKRCAELLLAHGAILETRLGDPSGALASYARVAELDPMGLRASVALLRVAGQTGLWDVAAGAFVKSAAARGAIDGELVQTFEAVAEDGLAWDSAASAFALQIQRNNPLAASVSHALLRQLGIWHRDRRGDADSAQAAFREAADREENATTLGMLADLERRAPGRELTQTLLRLAAATNDDLDVLYEAGTVSLHAVHDPELSEPILERVFRLASTRWASRSEAAPQETFSRYALWAVEQLVQIRLDANDGAGAAALLERGAKLPFSPEKSRELRYRAAELSSEVVGDTAHAVELCRGILAEAPDDAVTIALLAGLYSSENRLEELLALRRRELALDPPRDRRLSLRLDIARVVGDLKGPSQERIDALRDNLEDVPGDPQSVDALASILEADGRHAELHGELVRQAERVEGRGDHRDAAALWARAGHIAETALSNVDAALDAYRRSVVLEPGVLVLDALADIHTKRGEHGMAVAWLERRLELTDRATPGDEDYRKTVRRLAESYRADGNESAARRCLIDALAFDPAATELRRFLADLYRNAGDWSLLAPLLADGVDFAEDAPSKVALLRQAAYVQRKKLDALAVAIPLLEKATALVPEDRSVRLALGDALRSAGRLEEAGHLLEAMLAEFGRRRTPERARVHYHLAHIARAEGNLEEALAQLEAASSIERGDPRILRLLGDVARQKGDLERAERAYRALLLLVRRQQPASDRTDDDEDEPVAASEVLYDLYQMASDQGQNDRANELLESAFETASENNHEALKLERVLRASGQTELVLRVLDTRIDRISEPSAAAEMLVARADLLAGTGRLGEALDNLLEALGKIPGSPALLGSAHDLATRAGALDRYVDRLFGLAAAAEGTDPLLASDLFMRIGTTAENELMDRARAADLYERSLATGRRTTRAYRALLRLMPDAAPARLANVLRRFVDAVDPEETDASARDEAMYRLAEIELGAPETRKAGAERLLVVLDGAPDYERALSLLVPAVRAAPDDAAVANAYERVARAVGGDALVLDALTLRAGFPDAPLEILRDGVELAHRTNDAGRLAFLLERLVMAAGRDGVESEYVWAFVELADLHETQKEHARAAELLERAADNTSGSEAFELRLRVAEMAKGPLDDLRRAARTYELLRREEPSDVRVWKPLLDVYRRLGARDELEACIAATVDAVYDPKERNHLRMERGRMLLEDPNRSDEAERLLREVLDEDPDHAHASVALSELLERTGRIEELNELLDRQLSAAKDRKDAEAVAALALRIGRNLETIDRDAAITLYRESLDAAPADRDLLGALLRLYGPSDDPKERAFAMERLLALETDDAAARLALELSALLESVGDADGVERALRRGYAASPSNDELRDRLIHWYSTREDHAGLAEVYTTDARVRRDPRARVEQLKRAAGLYRDKLSDPGKAATVLVEAATLAPEDVDLVEELCRTYSEAARPAEALRVVSETILRGAFGPDGRARLLLLRARLRPTVEGSNNLAALGASISDLDQAAALSGDGHEAELVSLLDSQREVGREHGDTDVERGATMRLAALLPKVGDQRRGLELLVAWVKRNPSDADAVRGLGQFAADAEKWSAAAKAYQRLVEITDGRDQVDAVGRFAEACERAGTPLDARSAIEQVYRKSPGNEMLLGRLRKMYEAAGAYGELAKLMIAEAEQTPNEDVRFERLTEAGNLSLRVEGGARVAIDAYRRAYDLRPEDHHAVIRYADTLAAASEIEDAANVLDRAIDAYGKRRSPELSELQHAMARVGRIAGDWEAVFAWLDAAVQTDRQNGAAASDLAVIAMDRGELDIAVKALQAVTLIKGDAPMSKAEAYLRQAMIAEQKGDAKKAVFLAKRALAQDADYTDAKSFLDRLGAG